MLKKVLLGIAVVIVVFLGFVATRPDKYHVERSQKIEAPSDVVFAHMNDLKAWASWSPWDKLDANMKKTYEGPAKGVGASYAWEGNDKVGKGKMTITDTQPTTKVAYKLEFIEPFAAVAATGFNIKPEGEKAVSVTWWMDGNNDFMGKLFGLFMNMDKAIGDDFEKGLATLKTVTEAQAKTAETAAKPATP
jgi:hypothetical protein